MSEKLYSLTHAGQRYTNFSEDELENAGVPIEAINAAKNEERRTLVTIERNRRLAAGTVLDVAGVGPIALQGKEQDRANLSALAQAAQLQKAEAIDDPIHFIAADNQIHELTPDQMIALWLAGQKFVSGLYLKARAIKDMDMVPEDVTSDALWT